MEEIEALNSNGKKTNFQPSLSMPLMGFAGNWNHEPILDKWAWEEGSNQKQWKVMMMMVNQKIPGP